MAVSAALARAIPSDNTVQSAPSEGADTFHQICAAFRDATDNCHSRAWSIADGQIAIEPLLKAITEFLSIFDALGSQFIAQLVSRDFRMRTDAIRQAAKKLGADSVVELVEKEKHSPPGWFEASGTDAVLWAKRVLQFVDELVQLLVKDAAIELKDACLQSYRCTLGVRHNGVTRTMFENALMFVPTREEFFLNLGKTETLDEKTRKDIEVGMREFITSVRPHVEALIGLLGEEPINKQ